MSKSAEKDTKVNAVVAGNSVLAASKEAFEAALKRFVTSTKESMDAAKLCANMAIAHFAEHGDLHYAQLFLDSMPKNYIRRVAFLKWLSAFSPVIADGNKLRKDKRPEAIEFNVKDALEVPFWEFAPDKEQIHYTDNNVVVALNRTIAKFEGERYDPADEKATAKLAQAKKVVATL